MNFVYVGTKYLSSRLLRPIEMRGKTIENIPEKRLERKRVNKREKHEEGLKYTQIYVRIYICMRRKGKFPYDDKWTENYPNICIYVFVYIEKEKKT